MKGRTNVGGASLNFKVVGGTTQPTSASENTIWVNTDTAISEWVFSVTEPISPVAGMVWFIAGTSSPTPINALKKNGLMVYPMACQQYVDGAWVEKTSEAYQGGTWVSWWDGTLYLNGDEYSDYTGGFVARATRYAATVDGNPITGRAPTLTKNASNMVIAFSISYNIDSGSLTTKQAINLEPYSKIVFDVHLTSRANGSEKFYVTKTATDDPYTAAATATLTSTTRTTVELDVANITEPMYVGINLYRSGSGQSAEMVIYSIKLVK